MNEDNKTPISNSAGAYGPVYQSGTPVNAEAVMNPRGQKPWYGRLPRGIKLAGSLFLIALCCLVVASLWPQQSNSEVPFTLSQATVTVTDQGFLPQELLVKPNTKVTWVNESDQVEAVGASPFPSHTTNPSLVSGQIPPHGTYSYVFTHTGTWTYQNDMNPLLNGTIGVSAK